MIDYHLDAANSILYVRPKAALAAEDFANLARTVDPHIETTGGLRGLIVETSTFPGWESLGAMMAHLRFVHDHHRRIKKVAAVTDSALGDLAERFANHFVSADIKHFAGDQLDAAKQWVLSDT